MIRLYSTHCPKCKVLEKKLESKNTEFEIIDNINDVVEFGQKHGINSAPILELEDGTVLNFVEANKYLNA